MFVFLVRRLVDEMHNTSDFFCSFSQRVLFIRSIDHLFGVLYNLVKFDIMGHTDLSIAKILNEHIVTGLTLEQSHYESNDALAPVKTTFRLNFKSIDPRESKFHMKSTYREKTSNHA